MAELREVGARIEIAEAGIVQTGIVQAWIPIAALEGFAALDVVRDITPPDYGVTRAGSGLSESQVAADGQTVTFTLLGETTFTYTVTAPAA